jgi:hypothetical protein
MAVNAARGDLPQNHVYVGYMSMFVIIYFLVRFSDTSTNHDFKIDFFQTFFDFFSRNFKMRKTATTKTATIKTNRCDVMIVNIYIIYIHIYI